MFCTPTAAPWTWAIPSRRAPSRLLPQCIAHRGYRAAFPENSMDAFEGAVQVGAHALETDVRLSADGVAVLSHDASLQRCFGIDKAVGDCDWEYLSTLQTLRAPRQGLPRLCDLLRWLAAPSRVAKTGEDGEDGEDRRRHVWVLLDIKACQTVGWRETLALMDAIATALSQVRPGAIPWEERIMLGCWNAASIQSAAQCLPGLRRAHIGFSLSYARHFLAVPDLAFNMAQHTLLAPYRGRRFMRDLLAARRALFVWTVNSERGMEWCLRQNAAPHRRPGAAMMKPGSSCGTGQEECSDDSKKDGLLVDGVITDDPKLFLDVCERYEDQLDGKAKPRPITAGETVGLVLHILLRHLLGKLVFAYRRFWLQKLDYLPEGDG
ncbi:hypothetical protein RJ55_02233 [Drechmeria coniospora]|nr:hypothetical protein RJ55_02233 [Drechmeria coniospora]